MADQYGAKKKTVGELLSTTGPNIVVPPWQRSYSWDSSHAETFWQDLIDFDTSYPGDNINDHEYFLGSIVLVDSDRDQLLLDGQQRLGTATILLSGIRDVLARYNGDAAIRTSQKYITDFDDSKGSYTFKLTLNEYDRDFFRREVQESAGSSPRPNPSKNSHRQIRRVRELFKVKLNELFDLLGGGDDGFKRILRIRTVLVNHVSLVAVTSADEDNAASVFETLNDRGIGLSTPDLLRNFLMQKAAETEREEVIECWRSILEVSDDAKVQDFLRHYWLSLRGDVKQRSLYREMKSTLIREKTDALTFSRDLEASATTYRDIASARDDDPETSRLLRGLGQLSAGALMPALLSAYAVGNQDERRTFVQAILAFFVRHRVIGNLENSRLESVVFDMAKKLRETKGFDQAIATLSANAPSDDQFEARFAVAIVPRRDTARYLLGAIELHSQATGEQAIELPDRVHIEHIYPQRPSAGNKWQGHGAIISRLGNQALLAKRINQKISNGEFDKKRDQYLQSQFVTTKSLADLQDWDSNAVDARQKDMAAKARIIWTIPASSAEPWDTGTALGAASPSADPEPEMIGSAID